MFMNLDILPAGKRMYTVAITTAPVDAPDDERWIEEYDLVFNAGANVGTLVTYAVARPDWPYGPDARVVGVSNQSDGYVMQQRWEGIKLTDPCDASYSSECGGDPDFCPDGGCAECDA